MSLMALARKVVPFPHTNASRINYDTAIAVSQRQQRQTDASLSDFPIGSPFGFAVMAAGENQEDLSAVAGKIVATEVFSELKFLLVDHEALEEAFEDKLLDVVCAAFECVEAYFLQNDGRKAPDISVIIVFAFENRLYWSSTGDPQLLLFRDDTLNILSGTELNLCSQDVLHGQTVDHGEIDSLDRCQVPKVYSTNRPTWIQKGDVLVAAAQHIPESSVKEIEGVLIENVGEPSGQIARLLVQSLSATQNHKDANPSVFVLKPTKF